MPIPESWVDRVDPLPGFVLIEREDAPARVGHLWLPETYRRQFKRALATVIRSGDRRVEPGDVVLVTEGAGRRIVFGATEKTVYYLVTYEQLRVRFARVSEHTEFEPGVAMWREIESSESIYRYHLNHEIFLIREDVADEGRVTAVGDQRGAR